MKKRLAHLLFILLFNFCGPSYSIITQKRLPNEPFQQALNRVNRQFTENKRNRLRFKETPVKKKVPIKEIDYSLVPEIKTDQELFHMFSIMRDSRFLYAKENPEFARRISWLYPDDGCFARAALSGMKLDEEELPRPMKIFAFGDLVVQTPYSAQGAVTWWYHVAELVRYMGAIYVLDPALNGKKPLLVDDWFNLMGSEVNLKGVVCNAYSYDPFDDCFNATEKSDQHARRDQLIYLKKEWTRMNFLGFDPFIILGTKPPWMDVFQ